MRKKIQNIIGFIDGHRLPVLVFVAVLVLLLFTLATCRMQSESHKTIEPDLSPRLTSLTLDGGYILPFSPAETSYAIKIPDGHPVVPKVEASAYSDVEVKVYQAMIPFGEKQGRAKVTLDDGTYTNTYEITFIKDRDLGFSLQYDDRYMFTPSYRLAEGEQFAFTVDSDAPNIEVDSVSGMITAIGVSDEPVTVNALVDGNTVDTLVVTQTEKAPLDLFVIAGQGNASGEGGDAALSPVSNEGCVYLAELTSTEMGTMTGGRKGFSPALAVDWYNMTGEKVFVIQTAMSGTSVKDWTRTGEAYELSLKRIKYFLEKLNAVDSCYNINRTVYFWLQGEWDISRAMSTEDYTNCYLDMHKGMVEDIGASLGAILPVRASGTGEEVASVSYTELNSVRAAQYTLHNTQKDIYIVTDLTEKATKENGFVAEDNLYFTQAGYNAIGSDVAKNLFCIYDADTDRGVRAISLYAQNGYDTYRAGGMIEITKGKTLQTMPLASPLYAENKTVKIEYTNRDLAFGAGGSIVAYDTAEAGAITKVRISADKSEYIINIKITDAPKSDESSVVNYKWEFNTLDENSGDGNLRLSTRSDEEGYTLENGRMILSGKNVDFIMKKGFVLSSEGNWSIEWSGAISDNGILFGSDFSKNGYIYLAPWSEAAGNSVRIVDDNGRAVYLKYGEFADANRESNVWKIAYDRESNTVTLYLNGQDISHEALPVKGVGNTADSKPFTVTLTNMFGRYGNTSNGYCYSGYADSIEVRTEGVR